MKMYFQLKKVNFQPAMLVFWRVVLPGGPTSVVFVQVTSGVVIVILPMGVNRSSRFNDIYWRAKYMGVEPTIWCFSPKMDGL